MTLPQVFLDRPLAHRGLHGQGRPENTRAACVAAIEAGYGIELDLQLSRDGVAMVFHDETLDRLTDTTGPVADRTAAALGQIRIAGTDQTIPTLADVLDLVGGAAPLLIELKDQDGALGDVGGTLEAATARTLESYNGDVALMSFNPNSVVRLAVLAPHIPRGLTTCDFCK
ncbi:MAG: glycerophosphodiester phosphodiesterase family protein, partial [Pseudomonadota bacterium]